VLALATKYQLTIKELSSEIAALNLDIQTKQAKATTASVTAASVAANTTTKGAKV
jgi:hypothetical protein